MTSSLLVVVGADVVRPSLAWLLSGGKKRKLVRNMVYGRDGADFDRLRRLCEQDPGIRPDALKDILFRCAVIIAAKGGMLADITVGDVLEILDAEYAVRGRTDSASATFRMLREAGVLDADTPTLQQIRSIGQRSVAELVDRHRIACRPIRDLLVAYLAERQPAIDYNSLVGLAYQLVRCFWFDLEQHHPGVDSLRLPREVAGAWKRRLRIKTTSVIRDGERVEVESERLGYLDTLATVRAFYLDLAEWGLEDPVRWGVSVIAVGIAEPDDPLDGPQAVDRVHLRELGDDRDRTRPDLLGLATTPAHAAQGVSDLVRRVVLDVRRASRQMQHMGRHDGAVVEDLHDVAGGAHGDLLADESPRHRVQRLPGFDVTVRGDPPEAVDDGFKCSGRQQHQCLGLDRGEHRCRSLAIQAAVLVNSVDLSGPAQRLSLHLG
jgi:hypothetical protein